MERQTGTIEDVVVRAKSRYTNVEDQVKYIQIGIDLIKRDYSDQVKSISFSYKGFDYQVDGYADAGGAYFWYNIFRGAQKVASKLERIKNGSAVVLFTSNLDFNSPITPLFLQ